MENIRITPIPAFKDNYIWAIENVHNTAVWIVDPGEAQPVLNYLQDKKLKLGGILITHHHHDHRGGVQELLKHTDIPVYGPAHPEIPANQIITERDEAFLPECALNFKVIEIPGHTLEHIAYYNSELDILFCGDTLFGAGCGRVFEGTYDQMYASLMKLSALPDNTKMYCAHEYTVANLKFALAVEPRNQAILARIADANSLRSNNTPTIPSTLLLEKETNPFLRCHQATVIQAAEQYGGKNLSTPAEVFAIVREWKNNFTG